MSLPAYPIAKDAHAALTQMREGQMRKGKGLRAARQSEAEAPGGGRATFVTQTLGPVYERREDALDAYAGLVEDDRKGHVFSPLPEDRVCRLLSRAPQDIRAQTAPLAPCFADGRRWPEPARPARAAWQLSIGYWKIAEADAPRAAKEPAKGQAKGQARHLRRKPEAKDLTPEDLLALSQNPLTAARPQKALDFGLFDFIPPDQPGIVIADE